MVPQKPRRLLLALPCLLLLILLGLVSAQAIRQVRETARIKAILIAEVSKMGGAELSEMNLLQRRNKLEMYITIRTRSYPSYQQLSDLQQSISEDLHRSLSLKVNVILADKVNAHLPPTITPTATITITPTRNPSPTLTRTPSPS